MFVLIRLIVIVVRAYAGYAFAAWQFSDRRIRLQFHQMSPALN